MDCAFWVGELNEYHRGVRLCCGVERVFVRKAALVVNHVGMVIRSVFAQVFRLNTRKRGYDVKIGIIREALKAYLSHPAYTL